MSACAACGHEPANGRFCPRCGRPTATATAAAPVQPPPPPPGSLPQPARFPLFADEVPAAPAEPTVGAPPTLQRPTEPPPMFAPPAPAPYDAGRRAERRSAGWLPWVAGLLFIALIAGVGGFLLLRDSGDDTTARDTGTSDVAAPADKEGDDADAPAAGDATDLTAQSQAAAPATAPDGVDNANRPVTFAAANMLDGDPRTCWRMAGDGTGSVLTFTFPEAVTLTRVGLVNGYAKNDPPNDWYVANRRVLEVEWSFDDGTAVTQALDEVRSLQTLDVDEVETSVVRLRIVRVSAAGGRDFTPISEVSLLGRS